MALPIHGPDEPVYTISVMARLIGVSTQVLRIWERECLVCPARTDTNNRLYSENDFYRLVKIVELTQQGINVAGIRAILGTVEIHYITSSRSKARENSYGQGRRN